MKNKRLESKRMEAKKEPTPMKRLLPSQQMEKEFLALAGQRAPLSEAVRLGAQLMLQKAVELEVSNFLGLATTSAAARKPRGGATETVTSPRRCRLLKARCD